MQEAIDHSSANAHPFLCASAHDAGWYPVSLSHVDGRWANVARLPLLPQREVDRRHGVTRYPRVPDADQIQHNEIFSELRVCSMYFVHFQKLTGKGQEGQTLIAEAMECCQRLNRGSWRGSSPWFRSADLQWTWSRDLRFHTCGRYENDLNTGIHPKP